MKSVALIANPFAGTKRHRIDATSAADLLREAGYDVAVLLTNGPGHATELAALPSREEQVPRLESVTCGHRCLALLSEKGV